MGWPVLVARTARGCSPPGCWPSVPPDHNTSLRPVRRARARTRCEPGRSSRLRPASEQVVIDVDEAINIGIVLFPSDAERLDRLVHIEQYRAGRGVSDCALHPGDRAYALPARDRRHLM